MNRRGEYGMHSDLHDGVCLTIVISGENNLWVNSLPPSSLNSICDVLQIDEYQLPPVRSLIIRDASLDKNNVTSLVKLLQLPVAQVELEFVSLSDLRVSQDTDFTRIFVSTVMSIGSDELLICSRAFRVRLCSTNLPARILEVQAS
jgi:hypothetical protein